MQKATKLLILKGDFPISHSVEGQEIISFDVLKQWMKSPSFVLRLFSYEEVGLHVYQHAYFNYPLLTLILLRLLSRKQPYIVNVEGNKRNITLKILGYTLITFIRDWLYKGAVFRQHEGYLARVSGELSTTHRAGMSVLQGPFVYLRTDLWFGISAGGSVGHIAGVVNELQDLSGNVIFLSTDRVPTVRDDVPLHLLQPIDRYWDFQEIPALASNSCFEKQTIDVLGNLIPSFIYQRYSLNNFTGACLARRYQVPFILEYNGSEVWIAQHWGKPLKYEAFSEKIEQYNLRMADIIVVVSRVLRDDLINRGVNAEKILVNPNGVDTERYSPKINGTRIRKKFGLGDKLIIGFLGTFGRWHGADLLAEAFGRFLKLYPEYREQVMLIMIGNGLQVPQVEENLKKFGGAAHSILTGFVPQNQGGEYLAACDILVSPHIPNADGTPFFGSPTKIFEYMAMEEAIIASNLDQIGEVLEHGRTACLVKPADIDALIDGLKLLIDNPSLRQQLGQAARQEVIAKYTWKAHVRPIIEKSQEQCG